MPGFGLNRRWWRRTQTRICGVKGSVSKKRMFVLGRPRHVPGEPETLMDQQLFTAACAEGDLKRVEECLKIDIIDPMANDNLPLRLAIYNRQARVIKKVMADPRVDVSVGGVLAAAVRAQDVGLTSAVLGCEKVNPSSPSNRALSIACRQGGIGVLRLLLADPRVRGNTHSEKLAPADAAAQGRAAALRVLLKDNRFNPAYNNNRALTDACSNGRVECVRILLGDGRVDPTALDSRALHMATVMGHLDVIKVLLQDGRADPLRKNSELFRIAVYNNLPKVAKHYLRHTSVDPTLHLDVVFRMVCKRGEFQTLRMLLADKRIDPAVFNNLAIATSIKYTSRACFRLLVVDPRTDFLEGRRTLQGREAGSYPLEDWYAPRYFRRKWRVVITCARLVVRCSLPSWIQRYYSPGSKGFIRAKQSFETEAISVRATTKAHH